MGLFDQGGQRVGIGTIVGIVLGSLAGGEFVRALALVFAQGADALEIEACLGIRPMRPGNAGRGKGPDFWCAFEDGEVKVIGNEPGNT